MYCDRTSTMSSHQENISIIELLANAIVHVYDLHAVVSCEVLIRSAENMIILKDCVEDIKVPGIICYTGQASAYTILRDSFSHVPFMFLRVPTHNSLQHFDLCMKSVHARF